MDNKYPSDREAKRAIIEYGRRMYERGYVAANDGNISVKVSPRELWVTPTGVSKGFMKKNMLIKLDIDGNTIKRGRLDITSEIKMHLECYRQNPEIISVCHAHPPVATSFAVAGIALDCDIVAEAVVSLGAVPVAPYATPGTDEVPAAVLPFIKDHNALLLANHGVLTWGESATQAYFRLETVEYCATLTMNTEFIIRRIGKLTNTQVDRLVAVYGKPGVKNE